MKNWQFKHMRIYYQMGVVRFISIAWPTESSGWKEYAVKTLGLDGVE